MAPFPALTICPLIPPMASRRRKVFESLRLPPNMTNKTAKFLVRYMYFLLTVHNVKVNDFNRTILQGTIFMIHIIFNNNNNSNNTKFLLDMDRHLRMRILLVAKRM